MDNTRAPRGKPKRKKDIELLDPEFQTAMLDGYARAIQQMSQYQRDQILRKVVKTPA